MCARKELIHLWKRLFFVIECIVCIVDAFCPSYSVVSMDTPNRTRVTYSKGFGRECWGGVLHKSIKWKNNHLLYNKTVHLYRRTQWKFYNIKTNKSKNQLLIIKFHTNLCIEMITKALIMKINISIIIQKNFLR